MSFSVEWLESRFKPKRSEFDNEYYKTTLSIVLSEPDFTSFMDRGIEYRQFYNILCAGRQHPIVLRVPRENGEVILYRFFVSDLRGCMNSMDYVEHFEVSTPKVECKSVCYNHGEIVSSIIDMCGGCNEGVIVEFPVDRCSITASSGKCVFEFYKNMYNHQSFHVLNAESLYNLYKF